MTTKVTIEFQTLGDAAKFLATVANMGGTTPPVAVVTPPAPKGRRVTRAEAPVENAALAPVVVEEQGPAVSVKAAPKAPNAPVQAVAEVNEAAVRAALREVVNTKSMKVAADILKDFGATSISQIKPADFTKFIEACKK